jgi:hypothetical protein
MSSIDAGLVETLSCITLRIEVPLALLHRNTSAKEASAIFSSLSAEEKTVPQDLGKSWKVARGRRVYSGLPLSSRARAPRLDESSERGSRGAEAAGREGIGRAVGSDEGPAAAGGDRPKRLEEIAELVDRFVPYFRKGGMAGGLNIVSLV